MSFALGARILPAKAGALPARLPAPVAKAAPRQVAMRAAGSVNVAAVAEPKQADWPSVAAGLEDKSPLEIMDHALATFGDEIGIAFSGAEDVALIEYAHLTGRKYRVFSLDTGRLNPETYQLFDAVEKHYGIHIEYTFPDGQEVMDFTREKGLFSFYEDGHQECCKCASRCDPSACPVHNENV